MTKEIIRKYLSAKYTKPYTGIQQYVISQKTKIQKTSFQTCIFLVIVL